MPRVFIIEDDQILTDCLALTARNAVQNRLRSSSEDAHLEPQISTFTNAIDAINNLSDALPDLILLDVLPSGPDAFSLLNELSSYCDTAKIPVILLTSLELSAQDLSHYGVVAILHKETMTPDLIGAAIQEALLYAE